MTVGLRTPRGRSNAAANSQKDPHVASGLIPRAADLKDRTGELPRRC